jgi:hypothetical protein
MAVNYAIQIEARRTRARERACRAQRACVARDCARARTSHPSHRIRRIAQPLLLTRIAAPHRSTRC